MAYFPHHIAFINSCISKYLGAPQGKRMLELGNQNILNAFWGKTFSPTIPEKKGKEYYSKLGVEHTSVDMNGRDGAVAVDLARPMDRPEWIGHFDIVTNSGTTEHVEPYEAQFICFQNIHRATKKGGLMIHIIPAVEELDQNGQWKYHCNNYYSRDFFRVLAEENGYQIVEQTVMNELLCVCLQKTSEQPFMEDQEKFLRHIARREGGIFYSGINDKRFTVFQRIRFDVLRKLHTLKIVLKNKLS